MLNSIHFSKTKFKWFYLIIGVLTFSIYGNGINNEYSLDDTIVVDGIKKIEKGIKAIPEIFTSHYAVDSKQQYGYRPLVTVTYALEKQFFGKLPPYQTKEEKKRKDKLTQANISHFVNVLLYVFTGIFLLRFLSLLFKSHHPFLLLVITCIFIAHPLHTEPVNNLKSRDELLMFLFTLLALINYLKFSFSIQNRYLLYGFVWVMLAMLSKKSTYLIVGLTPLTLFFLKANLKTHLKVILSVLAAIITVILIKKGLVAQAGSRQIQFYEAPLRDIVFLKRIPTVFYTTWWYVKQLIYPKDMAFYYGYNAIPIAKWSHYQVWLGLGFYLIAGGYGFYQLLKRKIMGFGIIWWLGCMLAFVNLFFAIVGIVADRFTYVFSLGFCIVMGSLLFKFFRVDTTKSISLSTLPKGLLVIVMTILIIYSNRVISRNLDWHDYLTTYSADITTVENSAKANALIANAIYLKIVQNPKNPRNRKLANDVVKYYQKAIAVDSNYITSYNSLGFVYDRIFHQPQQASYYFKKATELDSNYMEAHLNLAVALGKANNIDEAFIYFAKTIKIDPNYEATYVLFNQFIQQKQLVNKGILLLEQLSQEVEEPQPIFMNIDFLNSKRE